MVAAASVFTTPPLRKVWDVALTAAGDTAAVVIPHGINFTDVGTAFPPVLTEIIARPYGASAVAASVAVPYVSAIDGTNVTMGFTAIAAAGNVRVHIQRMHTIQG